MRKTLFVLFVLAGGVTSHAQDNLHVIKHLKITILSTMLAQRGWGEWGFSALIEADSTKILFDAGSHENTVLQNSKALNIDLSDVNTLILSHDHTDHTAGWLPLRNALAAVNKNALGVTHVAPGFFDTRINDDGRDDNDRKKDSLLYIATGGRIVLHKNFEEIAPGIYLTGIVPRVHPEKNYDTTGKMKDATGRVIADNVPEDMALVIRTTDGLVLVTGCGHSGIVNNLTHVNNNLKHEKIYTVIGGLHLLNTSDDKIQWTAQKLKENGIRYFMGAHCTGIEPVYQIRTWAGLKRGECIVGSVGATFQTGKGFTAGSLTR
ncbi:MBL fold metallo-hydrolase [Panacibacter ginsenosidivorans]|uniref:MBL fold metallo-hydrolase n=1 Tax=Panacibacter ginsenosidivorans TaxID=1813871 RepID=A0A5B8VAD8_9BACT|nr:MBL fold metallo-hydrolase [Panacibacter ginsenosidivorans]QEC67831.1 MBL fold metallo-hydrolase [Panacibacter ginsenosidivorans]